MISAFIHNDVGMLGFHLCAAATSSTLALT
jgi:hypothetical protein